MTINRNATLADWLEYRGLPPDATLSDLVKHERGNARLAAEFERLDQWQRRALCTRRPEPVHRWELPAADEPDPGPWHEDDGSPYGPF